MNIIKNIIKQLKSNMENQTIHNYSEYIDGQFNGHDAQFEIVGEVYDEPLHQGGDGDPIHTRIVIIERIGEQKTFAGLLYFRGQLTESELRSEVKAMKETMTNNITEYLFEDVAKKYKK